MANPEDLGRYRLKRLLGRGALGEVWAADDLEQPGEKVAVKIMHAAEEELALARIQFAREGRLASMLRHPNVVEIYDAGEAAGTSFLVMELVEGRPLRALLKEGPPIAERLRWIGEVANALLALHRTGIIHRDVKPANVLVRADRSICLVDLGIAKWLKFDLGHVRDDDDMDFEPPPSRNLAVEYVPPETTDETIYDELSDQFAWGVLSYEILVGHPPEPGAFPLTDRTDVAPRIARAVERARSDDRDARFDGMESVLAELGLVASSRPPPLASAARTSPLPPPPDEVVEDPSIEARLTPLRSGKRNAIIVLAVAFAACIAYVLLLR